MNKEILEKKLSELLRHYEVGTQKLAEHENAAQELKASLLKLSGAIEVIEELLRQHDEK